MRIVVTWNNRVALISGTGVVLLFVRLLIRAGLTCLIVSLAPQLPAAAHDGTDRDRRGCHHREPRTSVAPGMTEICDCYEISGKDEQQLRDQLAGKGTAWHDGKKYDALTSWRVTWEYDRRVADGMCSAGSFRPTADITIRYPNWTGREGAPRELAEKWDRYLESLIRHEEGHRDLIIEAVAGLSRAVAELPPAGTCEELDRKIRCLCQEHMQRLREDSEAYDEGTLHGLAQGAVFP